jgi:hypothetical protein
MHRPGPWAAALQDHFNRIDVDYRFNEAAMFSVDDQTVPQWRPQDLVQAPIVRLVSNAAGWC